MLLTAKPTSEGQSFSRRLLSEYNTDVTLDNYIDYFLLKDIVKSIQSTRNTIQKRIGVLTNNSSSNRPSVNGVSPVARLPHKFPSVSNFETQLKESSSLFIEPNSPLSLTQLPNFAAKDTELNNLSKECDTLTEKFFEELHKSYKMVKKNLLFYERSLIRMTEELHQLTDTQIKARESTYIPDMFLTVESINKYRSLNLLAFRKIMRKFLERCAVDSLELQKRTYAIDHVIATGNVSKPSVDLRGIVLQLIAVYGTVFKLSYEDAHDRLKAHTRRSGVNVPRIIPFRESFFFGDAYPHRESHFAIRVIPGSLSVSSVKMITEVLQCPRFAGPCCSKFANGEVNIHLNEPVRGDDVFIVQSISATEETSNATAIMELCLMVHSAQLAAASRITAVIPHMAYTKNVASISALAEMIECMGCHHIITVDMHSDQVEGMFSIPLDSISAKYEFIRYLYNQLKEEQSEFNNLTIVAPKGNFLGRAKDFADALMRYGELDSETQFVSVCTAVKRVKTRKEPSTPRPTETPINATPSRFAETGESPMSDYDSRSPFHRSSPTSSMAPQFPSMADEEMSETMEGYVDSADGHVHDRNRSSSTFGIEKALMIQEKGKKGIVTHQLESDCTDPVDSIALVGDVRGRVCVILETVIDEAVNITQVAKCLKAHGAERIILIATHCVLSGKAQERLENGPIELIITTDSVQQDATLKSAKFAKKTPYSSFGPPYGACDRQNTHGKYSGVYLRERLVVVSGVWCLAFWSIKK